MTFATRPGIFTDISSEYGGARFRIQRLKEQGSVPISMCFMLYETNSAWDFFINGNHCGWCSVPENVGRNPHGGFEVSQHSDIGVRNSWITLSKGNRLVQTAL